MPSGTGSPVTTTPTSCWRVRIANPGFIQNLNRLNRGKISADDLEVYLDEEISSDSFHCRFHPDGRRLAESNGYARLLLGGSYCGCLYGRLLCQFRGRADGRVCR